MARQGKSNKPPTTKYDDLLKLVLSCCFLGLIVIIILLLINKNKELELANTKHKNALNYIESKLAKVKTAHRNLGVSYANTFSTIAEMGQYISIDTQKVNKYISYVKNPQSPRDSLEHGKNELNKYLDTLALKLEDTEERANELGPTRSKLSMARKTLTDARKQIDIQAIELTNLKEELSERDKLIVSLQTDLATFKNEKEILKKQVEKYQKIQTNIQNAPPKSLIKKTKKTPDPRIAKLQEKVGNLQSLLQQKNDIIKEQEKQIKQIKNMPIPEIPLYILAEMKELKDKNRKLQEQYKQAQTKNSELQVEITKLNEEVIRWKNKPPKVEEYALSEEDKKKLREISAIVRYKCREKNQRLRADIDLTNPNPTISSPCKKELNKRKDIPIEVTLNTNAKYHKGKTVKCHITKSKQDALSPQIIEIMDDTFTKKFTISNLGSGIYELQLKYSNGENITKDGTIIFSMPSK